MKAGISPTGVYLERDAVLNRTMTAPPASAPLPSPYSVFPSIRMIVNLCLEPLGGEETGAPALYRSKTTLNVVSAPTNKEVTSPIRGPSSDLERNNTRGPGLSVPPTRGLSVRRPGASPTTPGSAPAPPVKGSFLQVLAPSIADSGIR